MTALALIEETPFILCADKPAAECSIIGYARVSTDDQDLSLQITALKKAGCELIYTEVQSTRKKRPVLETMKRGFNACCKVLTVWRLDRLGRDLVEMVLTVQHFQKLGINLISLTENLSLDTAAGMLAFHILAAFAQYERNLISERTKSGLAATKARGTKLGTHSKIVKEVLLGFLACIWTADIRMTNKLIVRFNDYGSTSLLQNHFKGERKRMREARSKGPVEFEKIKKQRLREFAKAEGVSIRQLNKIIKDKNRRFEVYLKELEMAA